jgi:hypothetical protein
MPRSCAYSSIATGNARWGVRRPSGQRGRCSLFFLCRPRICRVPRGPAPVRRAVSQYLVYDSALGNHSSPFTLVPGFCSVAHRVCFLALSACSLSLKTTSILSPGPGRRNSIFRPLVTFALSRLPRSLSFTSVKSSFSAFVRLVSMLTARSSLRAASVDERSFWLEDTIIF